LREAIMAYRFCAQELVAEAMMRALTGPDDESDGEPPCLDVPRMPDTYCALEILFDPDAVRGFVDERAKYERVVAGPQSMLAAL
jgi:hypothetical protein